MVVVLHISRGVQNKVIEGMAMGSAIIVTSQIRESLSHCPEDVLLAQIRPRNPAMQPLPRGMVRVHISGHVPGNTPIAISACGTPSLVSTEPSIAVRPPLSAPIGWLTW